MKKKLCLLLMLAACLAIHAKSFLLLSPDKSIAVNVNIDKTISYAVSVDKIPVLSPSTISMATTNGNFGKNSKLKSSAITSHQGTIKAFAYKKDLVEDHYNELALTFKENFQLIFRAYNEGIAYRFVALKKGTFDVKGEQAEFRFPKDWNAFVPYTNSEGTLEQQTDNSFENTYTHARLSQLNPSHLAFIPVIIEADKGIKIGVSEADLENYPGMFVINDRQDTTLKGYFAGYPKTIEQGGHNNLQELVKSREDYLVRCKGQTRFPWRVLCISHQDKDLMNNDMVYCLASPSRLKDTSWIHPGKVAWDWWNDWGLYNVPFKSGVNTATYKAYIDFAAKNKIEYVILDEGWAVNGKADLMQIVPEINLSEIISYGKQKGVGIILWAGYYAFDRDMEEVCKHYSEMGVKGFKIDFFNRDDAACVNFHYRAAAMAAKYHLMLDFHGTYKPTGLNRTYPNVLNFEGVAGQEQDKWSTIKKYNQVNYDVILPYARQLQGQMDYTQGAMRNGTKETFYPSNSNPMSQGTRCHQLAEYVVFFSPLNMLCDSPTHYEKEQESTDFIAGIPTTWDKTLPLTGKIGEYAAVARCKDNNWYVGAINNWTARDLTLNLPFLAGRTATVFQDGANADRFAEDYVKKEITIPADGVLKIHLAPGGGYAMKIHDK
ncbi:glycoside hydrolase family 97 protein [Prevotella cerevisiae]|uniref:Glycoside hydrolase family 97 protein n=1 Tax=Segatella cerevisiae TaxID=2053716 RepID=A0ABT1BX68_9BACT|nr:glycoside hydrolase family 97 protein [Segatella cerevisiae]MCO6025677.1 glycoside hydrolase family 97 protein [Segatella cerevisiae]